MRIENQCDRVRSSSLIVARFNDVDRCRHYVALFSLFVSGQARELQRCYRRQLPATSSSIRVAHGADYKELSLPGMIAPI